MTTALDHHRHLARRHRARPLAAMEARYPHYLLADSQEGRRRDSEETRTAPKTAPTRGDIRHGFVYEREPHITLKPIANNAEIDDI